MWYFFKLTIQHLNCIVQKADVCEYSHTGQLFKNEEKLTMSNMLGDVSVKELHGPVSDLMLKIQGDDGRIWFDEFKRFLRKEECWVVNSVPKEWFMSDAGVIYFDVTSDGTSGPDWIPRHESNGFQLGDYAKNMLRSPDFKTTNGVTTKVAVICGSFFSDKDRITKTIRREAGKRELTKPNAEVACLIREKFSDKAIREMGLTWIVTMHKPINNSAGGPGLFCVHRSDNGYRFDALTDIDDDRWSRRNGFAFAVSESHSKITAEI